jgi:hypothetical protein
MARLDAAWQEAVFALYLAEGKIEPEVFENIRTWQMGYAHQACVRSGSDGLSSMRLRG